MAHPKKAHSKKLKHEEHEHKSEHKHEHKKEHHKDNKIPMKKGKC